ncbi:45146_t:CDS:2 [Gigaspora margarita]|uniref:45146_t:CDS:1 n=1 Tax=Gigaspora margarita TaxID=4874 RepID=A0ABN7U5U3_GIGMA|nr:45146_t:CDS:2 [Gigaspora margarita]
MSLKYKNELNSKENIIHGYDNFENFEAINIGESDLVYKATFKKYSEHVILKPLIISKRFALKDFIEEFNRYQNVKLYDNILRIFGLTMPDPHSHMVILEYFDGETLRQYLSQNFKVMKWNNILHLAKQIANAVMHLHANNIIHGNLNSENILVHKGIIKINKSPFGFDCLNAIVCGKRETEVIGTLQEYSMIYRDCWKYYSNQRPNIQHVVSCLDKISFQADIFQLFIDQFNITANSSQTVSKLNQYFENNQINPIIIFDQLTDQDYNSSMIGYFYEHGIGTEIDYYKAFELYNNSSNNDIKNIVSNPLDDLLLMNSFKVNNLIIGKTLLGLLYSNGRGVAINKSIAFKLFLEVVEIGSGIGEYYVGTFLNNENKSFEWFSKSAKRGNSMGQFAIGKYYQKDKNYLISFKCYSKSATGGNSYAQYELANYYKYGNHESQFALGNIYMFGKGTLKDTNRSFYWFLKSAKAGNCNSQFQIGLNYKNGIGVAKNINKAIHWFILAKTNGHKFAHLQLTELTKVKIQNQNVANLNINMQEIEAYAATLNFPIIDFTPINYPINLDFDFFDNAEFL